MLACIIGWLFFAGWLYAERYLDAFGITITQAEIPYQTQIMYGAIVFEFSRERAIALCISLFMQAYFIWRMNIGGLRVLVIVMLNTAICFAAAHNFASNAGKMGAEQLFACNNKSVEDIKKQPCKRPYIRVYLQPGEMKDSATAPQQRLLSDVLEPLRSGCFMLIWPDKMSLNMLRYQPVGSNQPSSRLRLLLSQVQGYKTIDSPPPECGVGNPH
jgi:hypothetical protein